MQIKSLTVLDMSALASTDVCLTSADICHSYRMTSMVL